MSNTVNKIYPITFEDVTCKPWRGEFKLEVGSEETNEEIKARIHHAMMRQGYVLKTVEFDAARLD